MGFPIGWTSLEIDTPRHLPTDESGWWPEEPRNIPRVAPGIPDRADRLKCIGNAVVSQQFAPFFQAIADCMIEIE